jgi:hypothetical protein
MASGAAWPMHSVPASGVTGPHTIGVVRGPAGGARCRERGALSGTSRRYLHGARAVPAGRQRGRLSVAGRLVRWRLPGAARALALAHDLRLEAPLAVPVHRPQRDHRAQAAAPRTAQNRSGSWSAPARTRSPSAVTTRPTPGRRNHSNRATPAHPPRPEAGRHGAPSAPPGRTAHPSSDTEGRSDGTAYHWPRCDQPRGVVRT